MTPIYITLGSVQEARQRIKHLRMVPELRVQAHAGGNWMTRNGEIVFFGGHLEPVLNFRGREVLAEVDGSPLWLHLAGSEDHSSMGGRLRIAVRRS